MSCCYLSCWQIVSIILGAIILKLATSNPRRAPSKPAVSSKRKKPRGGSGKSIVMTNPSTGEKIGQCKAFTPKEVKEAIDASQAAAKEWAQTSFAERRAVLMDIMDWIVANQDTVIEWSVKDSGKTVTEAALGEVMTTCEKIRWIVAHGESCLADESRGVPLLLLTKKATVQYYPLGVIGIIVPWNYPVHNVLSAVVAALFAGNGACVKVSEWTCYSAEPLENMLREILAKRGHNPDLVQIIAGYGDAGAALITSGVDKVLFIGSPATGKKVMAAASSTLTPVILELGGKDPFVVFNDADFDHMLDIAVRGAFINCGQNCIAAERFYVQEGIYDKFVEAVSKKLNQCAQGASSDSNRCDFGAITMPGQVDIVERLVADAVKKGAKVIAGGSRVGFKINPDAKSADGGPAPGVVPNQKVPDKTFHQPTVLANVNHTMEIANEEAFGPVMTIIKFKGEDDLVEMANSTPYALGCSVFSKDYAKAHRVADRIVSGMVTINDFAMVPMVQSLPFGGCKASGFGHFNGREGLRGFSRIKSVVTDRFPIRMAAPDWLQYPVAANSRYIVGAAVKMVYGQGWLMSASSLFTMLKLVLSANKTNEGKKQK